MAIGGEDLRMAMEQMSNRAPWPHKLGAIETMRAARPVSSPVAGGTHTQRRLEADESSRQFGEQMELQRAQMALQERLARMQIAAQGSAAASARKAQEDAMAAAEQQRRDEADSLRALVAEALTMGPRGPGHIKQVVTDFYDRFQDPGAAFTQAIHMYHSSAYDAYGNPNQFEAPKPPMSLGPAAEQFMPRFNDAFQEGYAKTPPPMYPSPMPGAEFQNIYGNWFPETQFRELGTESPLGPVSIFPTPTGHDPRLGRHSEYLTPTGTEKPPRTGRGITSR